MTTGERGTEQWPWGLRRMAPYSKRSPVSHTRIELDPRTQVALRFDAAGQPVELGKHGTQRPTQDSTRRSDDSRVRNDSTPDYEQD